MASAKSSAAKKDRGLSAGERVEAHLRKAIYAGTLRPRQRIIEEDLARELEVSRGPVREALLRLERDGLVARRKLRRLGERVGHHALPAIAEMYFRPSGV